MTRNNNATIQLFDAATIAKRTLIGAAIGYILITLFLLVPGVTVNPNWSKFWMVKPLIIVPLAGAAGGVFYHLMDTLRKQKGWNKIVVYTVSFIVYIIGMFLGIVVGLDGTLWN